MRVLLSLSPLARAGIRAWLDAHGGGADDDELGDEAVAWIWFRLRSEPDSAEVFPRGKWATLQRLEQLLDESVQRERAASGQDRPVRR